jgi:NedA-like, galactose-binding domain
MIRCGLTAWFRCLAIFAGCIGLTAPAAAKPLSTSSSITGIWTAGPAKMAFVRDTDGQLYVFDETPSYPNWYGLTFAATPANISDRAVPVVVNTPTGWQTHVFFPTGTGADRKIVHAFKHYDANGGFYWDDATSPLPAFPGVTMGLGFGATSNVYRRGDALEPQGTSPQMAVYFVDGGGGLWQAMYSSGVWAGFWASLSVAGSFDLLVGKEIEVSNEFNNGVFLTSVWAVGNGHTLVENHGAFAGDRFSRTWSNYAFDDGHFHPLDPAVKPVAVTWYDRLGQRNPSFVHTRVMVERTYGSGVEAFYRGAFGGSSAWDDLGLLTSFPVSAGAYVGDCGGCPSPPQESLVMAFDDQAQGLAYLAKDNTNVNPPPTWTAVPPLPSNASSNHPFTRVDLGPGSGTVFAINSEGHLFELDPSTRIWADRGYPGMGRYVPVAVSQSSRILPDAGGPELANDGNADGIWDHHSVTHTGYEYQPWWKADLGQVRTVDFVDVYNRTDCCAYRLTNFNVSVSTNGVDWTTFNVPGQGATPTSVPIHASARYVRVQLVGSDYLSLAEVSIWSASAPPATI